MLKKDIPGFEICQKVESSVPCFNSRSKYGFVSCGSTCGFFLIVSGLIVLV